MTPFNHLVELIQTHSIDDGWVCIKMTHYTIVLRHPIHGEKAFKLNYKS